MHRKVKQVSKSLREIAEDPGIWFPPAYATLNKASGGPMGLVATGISAAMIGAKLHQKNKLGPLSTTLQKFKPLNNFLKKEAAVLNMSGYSIMGASVLGLTFLNAGLWASAASFLIGFSLHRKAVELTQNTKPDLKTLWQKSKSKALNSEIITGGVAYIAQALALGPYVFLSYPLLTTAFAAAATGNNDAAHPRWRAAKWLGLSDASFSRWMLATSGLIAGVVGGLALGNLWMGISASTAGIGNWMIFRMMREKDIEQAQIDSCAGDEGPIAPQPVTRASNVQNRLSLQNAWRNRFAVLKTAPFLSPLFNRQTQRQRMGYAQQERLANSGRPPPTATPS